MKSHSTIMRSNKVIDFLNKWVAAQVQDSARKTVMGWDDKLRTYKKWFITVLMILFVVFLVLGRWKELLVTYLIGHFHVMLNENYWKICSLAASLEKKE